MLEARTFPVKQRIAAVRTRTLAGSVLLLLCTALTLRLLQVITGPLQRLLCQRFNDMLVQLRQRGRERDRTRGISIDGVGHMLELASERQGDSPESGAAALQRLLDEGVVATEGPRWSNITLGREDDHSDGVGLTANDDGVLVISGGATSERSSTSSGTPTAATATTTRRAPASWWSELAAVPAPPRQTAVVN